jgi:hypothetical protein
MMVSPALHVFEGPLAQVEVGMDVRVKGMDPLFIWQVEDFLDHIPVGGVVDEDVDGAHLRQGRVDNTLAVLLEGDIQRQQMTFPTILLYQSPWSLARLSLLRAGS